MQHRHSRTEPNVRRFELWNACKPISWVNVGVSDGGVARGLASEVVEATVRGRLRAAGLHGRDAWPLWPSLYVGISALGRGRAFYVKLEFWKRVFDPISGEDGTATTWERGMVGQGDAALILSLVSKLTDEFIDAYLRVNASACQGPDQT